MHNPESKNVLIISEGPLRGEELVLHLTMRDALNDKVASYFGRPMDEFEEEAINAERAARIITSIFEGLREFQAAVGDTPENQIQWVEGLKGAIHRVDVGFDREAYLTNQVAEAYGLKGLGEDDMSPAGLTAGLAYDIAQWLNKQLPAVLKAQQELNASRVSSETLPDVIVRPEVPHNAACFAVSSGDWIEELCFDPLTAFSKNATYVEVFDKAGKPITIYRWIAKGDARQEPEFEGYSNEF